MLIVMKHTHSSEQLDQVITKIRSMGYTPHVLPGSDRVAVGITGNRTSIEAKEFEILDGVLQAIPVTTSYKLASRDFHTLRSSITVGSATFGPGHFVVIAGPCAVESEEQTIRIAKSVKALGAHLLRGGAFKPRSSPYSFQGLGLPGLKILKQARQETGLPIVTEALDVKGLESVYDCADVIQIGARNMQNFSLLQEVGKLDKPILLKRGMSATIDEWLLAAEYIMEQGNHKVILCERGIRSFDSHARNLLDLGAVAVLDQLSHLPIVVDPSHATGKRSHVIPMARAALAAGAAAIMVDVHDRPHEALCDGPQALLPEDFASLMQQLRILAQATNLRMP